METGCLLKPEHQTSVQMLSSYAIVHNVYSVLTLYNIQFTVHGILNEHFSSVALITYCANIDCAVYLCECLRCLLSLCITLICGFTALLCFCFPFSFYLHLF